MGWVWSAENPPGWAEWLFWGIVAGFALQGLIAVLDSDLFQNWYQRRRERKRAKKLSIDGVDAMDGHEFERYVAAMLERLGYSVERRGGSRDFGADAIASRGSDRFVVQAKHRGPGGTVGPGPVQSTMGAKEHHNCNRSMVVTNRYFTEGAYEMAGSICVLVDREDLADWIDQNYERS